MPEKVQDIMISELLEDEQENKQQNELLELLHFTKQNGVPLKDEQVRAMFYLNEMGLGDLAQFANAVRPELTPTKKFFKLIDKITLADRIKGNVKLSNLLKAQAATPSQNMPSVNDQPKALREKDLK